MNHLVDTTLLFDYSYMREKIRAKLNVANIVEIPDILMYGCPIGLVMNALSEYNIRIYYGLLNCEKLRVSNGNTSLLFYTNTNVKVQLSNTVYYSGSGVSISFSSDDGLITCSAHCNAGEARLTGDLTPLQYATPYIDPAIYLDYLMCCGTSEAFNAFTKHELALARLRERNRALMEENTNLMDECADLSTRYDALETTHTYLLDENNGFIESERELKAKVRYLKEQIEELNETLDDKQMEIDRIRYIYLALLLLYIFAFGLLVLSCSPTR